MATMKMPCAVGSGGGCQVDKGTVNNPASDGTFDISFVPDLVIVYADRRQNDYVSFYLSPNSYLNNTYSSSSLGVISGYYGYKTNMGGSITVNGTQATFTPNATWNGQTLNWVAFKF